MVHTNELEKLRIADPDTFVWVKGRLEMLTPPPSKAALSCLVEETIWGLSQEEGMGTAVAGGLLHLMQPGSRQRRTAYVDMVHQAARTGATYGRIVATFLASVLNHGPGLLQRFQQTLEVMMGKGTYTLTTPLEAMADLLAASDEDAARAYLDLLADIFAQPLSYNQSLRLVYLLPRAVRRLAPDRREFQIRQLRQLALVDLQLVEPFVDGLDRGLGMLDAPALGEFVAKALEHHARAPEMAIKFLSLTSKVGQEACAALQRAATLTQIQGPLNRYLHARLGRAVAVRPLADLPWMPDAAALVVSDGRFIYLPAELDRFGGLEENLRLYKTLARLEAGHFEYGTYDFDLDRAVDRYPDMSQLVRDDPDEDPLDRMCDGERFIRALSPSELIDDLFCIYEKARVRQEMARRYPGLARRTQSLLRLEARRLLQRQPLHLLTPVAVRLMLDDRAPLAPEARRAGVQQSLADLFTVGGPDAPTVETSAHRACLAFAFLSGHAKQDLRRYSACPMPFGQRLHWPLVSLAADMHEQAARRIRLRLRKQGLRVYRSDLRQRLEQGRGRLSMEDIDELVISRTDDGSKAQGTIDASALDLANLLRQSGLESAAAASAGDAVFDYPEWDHHLQDYLRRHARVQEMTPPQDTGAGFYQATLNRHGGLVTRMRRAFELLKPEGLALLRQWPEGDDFDYRALLDFAIDRRAGRIPSDRLFIKRLKQVRDVAVLLLVDLSRSTANPVAGGHSSVLDLAKAASVLFCEALEVVGDKYAIAGFSGSGRHAVHFYRIKGFGEPLGETVRTRLSGLQPQRSTRMGAAIRHAASWLDQVESRIRLLLVVSDGFPNDLGYKADYAIADTRRAVQEARSRNFHVKAITVNIGSDPRLDDLYGRVHHHVIGDVRELPDKLLRLYGTLTRH